MKRFFPKRSYGKFECLDGINHDWFMPVLKTFVHYVKSIFFDQELQLDLKQLIEKTTFPSRSVKPLITWLGHSTFLIQVGNKNILTDPIFGALSAVFRRLVPTVVSINELPVIDYVVISHNHFDHMDSKTLLELKNRFPDMKILVPMGDKDWFDRHIFKHVSEHMWWDDIVDGEDQLLQFTFLPANHWSQRTLFDKNRSLWGSWMICYDNFKIYFAGDTSWGMHFAHIGYQYQSIDIALLPIAPGEPRSWMKDSHINAQEAVQAFIDLKARILIPMHWGTFHLGFDEYYAPIELLKQSWKTMQSKLQARELKVLKIGALAKDLQHKIIVSIAQKTSQLSV